MGLRLLWNPRAARPRLAAYAQTLDCSSLKVGSAEMSPIDWNTARRITSHFRSACLENLVNSQPANPP